MSVRMCLVLFVATSLVFSCLPVCVKEEDRAAVKQVEKQLETMRETVDVEFPGTEVNDMANLFHYWVQKDKAHHARLAALDVSRCPKDFQDAWKSFYADRDRLLAAKLKLGVPGAGGGYIARAMQHMDAVTDAEEAFEKTSERLVKIGEKYSPGFREFLEKNWVLNNSRIETMFDRMHKAFQEMDVEGVETDEGEDE